MFSMQEIAGLNNHVVQLMNERDDLQKQRDACLEALKPFAHFGKMLMNGKRSHVPKAGPWHALDAGCESEASLDIEHFKAAIAICKENGQQ